MIESIRRDQPQYSFEEYKSMLNLMCGIDQLPDAGNSAIGSAGGGVSDKVRRLYNEALIDLHALVIDDW